MPKSDPKGKQVEKTRLEYLYIFMLETIGTAMLLIAVNFSDGNPLVCVSGIFSACMISAKLTGAHFNASLSIGVYIIDGNYRQNIKLLLTKVAGEFLGAYLGQYYSYLELEEKIAIIKPENDDNSLWYVFFMEWFFTFIMMSSIFHNMSQSLTIFNDMVIGVTSSMIAIFFCCNCSGKASGAVFNATIGTVNPTFVALVGLGTHTLKYLPAFILGPLMGAISAALFTLFAQKVVPDEQKHSVCQYSDLDKSPSCMVRAEMTIKM